MVTSITSKNFDQEVKKSEKPVIIDVYATWCGPCQHMTPIFEELSKELSDKYKFAKLNVDESREVATNYNVSSVPTFLFIKNGELQGSEVGYMSKDDLKNKMESYLS